MRVQSNKPFYFLVVFILSSIERSITFAEMESTNINLEESTVEPDQSYYLHEYRPTLNNCPECVISHDENGYNQFESSSQRTINPDCDNLLDPGSNSSTIHFTPKFGPYEGGTNITIQIYELDCPFNETESKIEASGTSCDPINDSCFPNESIICRIGETSHTPHTNFTQGPVIIRTKGSNFTSETNYTTVNRKIHSFSPTEGPQTGGTELTIQGEYLNTGDCIEVLINDLPCIVFFKNHTTLICSTIATRYRIRGHVAVKFDGFSKIFDKYLYQYTSADHLPPEYSNVFIPQGTPQGGNQISVNGEHFGSISKLQIEVSSPQGEENPTTYTGECNMNNDTSMTCCSPIIPDIKNCSFDFNTIEFPKLLHYKFVATMLNGSETPRPILDIKHPKFLLYCNPTYSPSWFHKPKPSPWTTVFIVLTALLIVCFILGILIYKRWKWSSSKKTLEIQYEFDRLELQVAAECKEAFAELQIEICDPRISRIPDNLPFWDYHTYVMKVLFPNIQDHSAILPNNAKLISKGKQLQTFHQLISNKTFLILFIKTLESCENFSINDRVYFASMLMLSLHNEMEYCTDIIKTLLQSMIEKHLRSSSHPKLLLRGSENIVEKMLSTWLSFSLHGFLQECAGMLLFVLFKGIKQQVNKGPVDEITSEARYSLSERKLIRRNIDYRSLTIYVSVSEDTACSTGLESALQNIPIKVLDCDTISQAKEKAVDGVYFAVNYSKRPKASELEFVLLSDSCDNKILCDIDSSSETEGEWRRLNTLRHYGITHGSKLNLESHKQTSHLHQSNQEEDDITCEILKSSMKECAGAPLISLIDAYQSYHKEWHLIKLNRANDGTICRTRSRYVMMPEIYLTRLLSTKGTLQKFVNDVFEVILDIKRQKSCFPVAIKYLFDFLDDQASLHSITDEEVVHAWKSNCLPLRFWVNLIKNPDFLFDVHKSCIIDSCLSVIAQAFMDSCSIGEHYLSKDSPTSKLLYAKDIPRYKEWVKKYYADIKDMPAVSPEYMRDVFAKESQLHCKDFNVNAAIFEIYKYAVKYKDRLMSVLMADESSRKLGLKEKLEKIFETMTNDSNHA
ncbi:plexin-A1-like [Planococcus citri]|uniref:plexin-A1-like n=1 Tax=Planococcus citri TaxID=170843 RepID=UPI0031F85885